MLYQIKNGAVELGAERVLSKIVNLLRKYLFLQPFPASVMLRSEAVRVLNPLE
jgi:hypothetical protein